VGFPWREGNRYRLLVDGENYFPRMLEAVAAARNQILLDLYMFESGHCGDRWISALASAVGRGVRVLALLDDLGSEKLRAHDRETLRARGVELAFYNPLRFGRGFANFLRDHRKALLIDGELAFVGGFGFADDFDPEAVGPRRWHDVALEIRGPCVGDWWRMFAADWGRWGTRTLAGPVPGPVTKPGSQSGASLGRVAVNRVGRVRETRRGVIRAIAAAENRVWLATAYFFPPRGLRRALRRAAGRGLDVRLLVAGPDTDLPGVRRLAQGFYGHLLRRGVRIYEFQGRSLHAKIALCDEWSTVGSSNLDHWTLRWTRDANQESRCPRLARELADLFQCGFESSYEIDPSQWRRRSWFRRLLERVLYRLHLAATYWTFRLHLRSSTRRRRGKQPTSEQT
jgi:phosphatidylserine/phosphatidylglycerophosphate/cardiolipin synthase-like enzyme